MKRSLTLLLALTGLALAQGARLEFETKLADLGELISGQSSRFVFNFTNTGDEDLIIRKVLATCDCAAALLSEPRIAPGNNGQIEVELSSKGRMGMVQSSIRIVSNDDTQMDGGPNLTVLQVQATIVSLVRVMPQAAYFPSVDRGGEDQRRIVLTPEKGDAVEVRSLECSASYITASWEPVESNGKTCAALTIKVGPDAPIGPMLEKVTVGLGFDEQPTLEVPVMGNVRGDILYGPLPLMLLQVERGAQPMQTISLQRDRGGELKILGVEMDVPWLHPHALELVDGKIWEVSLRIGDDAPSGHFLAYATIAIDDPVQPSLQIPVTGQIRPRFIVEPAGLWIPLDAEQAPPSLRVRLPADFIEGFRVDAPAWLDIEQQVHADGYSLALRVTGNPEPGQLVLSSRLPGETRLVVPIVLEGSTPGPEVEGVD